MINKANFINNPGIEAARSRMEQLYSDAEHCTYEWRLPGPGRYQRLPGERVVEMDFWQEYIRKTKDIPGVIGMGKDRMVARIEGQPELVMSVFHEPQSWYYLQDLLRVNHVFASLFPHNFPRIHGFFGNNDLYIPQEEWPKGFYYTGIWTDLIAGVVPDRDSLKEGLYSYNWSPEEFALGYDNDPHNSQVLHPFRKVLDLSQKIGLPLQALGFDPHKGNFILSADGGEYYIDLLHGPFHSKTQDFFKTWKAGESIALLNKEFAAGTLPITSSQLNFINSELTLLGNQEP